ncbi:MAG: hypothetical protein GXP31_03200 [Kiritimatiellaeota bacterium]|nr:hypothetical protein [Kiritimatiellota bacterium]
MNVRLERFREMGLKAVEFTVGFQQPDGGYVWDGFVPDAYHKQPYSWGVSGVYAPAHKLLNWVKRTTLQPTGGLADYRGDVYKQSWFFQGAHRMGRVDVSYPIMEFLLSCQTPCGGLPHFEKDERLRSLATAWAGISALYFGRLDVAERTAEWCVRVLEQQPEPERFFYFQTERDGRLWTADPTAGAIDFDKPKQPYWEIGLPWMLMGRLYQATSDERYLDLAERFYGVYMKCHDDRFTYAGSGKGSLAAAIHYLNTGDIRARDAVYTFLEFLLDTQYPEGGWRDETEPDIPLIYIDHAAEFNVWIQEDVNILAAME